MAISDERVAELEKVANKLRYDIIMMIGTGKPGHLGGSSSIADIIAVLYFHKMRHDSSKPKWPDRDRFLLSKGHAALAQYAALAECGYFDKRQLSTLKELGSMLQGHPEILRMPGIEANTGSLGQGLSVACGMALAGKLDKKQQQQLAQQLDQMRKKVQKMAEKQKAAQKDMQKKILTQEYLFVSKKWLFCFHLYKKLIQKLKQAKSQL